MSVAGGATLAAGGGDVHELRSDNGVYELSYIVANNEAMIGNYYYAPGDDALVVSRVDVALGFGQGGRPFELYLYNDPDNDGDPTNAELLSTTAGTVLPGAPFARELRVQAVEIGPVEVTGGFFAAVRLADQPFTPTNYNGDYSTAPSAFRLSYGGPTNNWRVVGLPASGPMGGINPIDTVDLSTNFVTNVQLNWVIRVSGSSVEPDVVLAADMDGNGRHDWFDIALFLGVFQAGDADFNADGQTNFFDVSSFLDAWGQGPA